MEAPSFPNATSQPLGERNSIYYVPGGTPVTQVSPGYGVTPGYGGVFGTPMTPPLTSMMQTTTDGIPAALTPAHHTINMPPITEPEAPVKGKGGIPGGAYAPRRHGFGMYPPVRQDITDRIFSKCCPQRLRESSWWTPSYVADYLVLILIWVAAGIMWFWYDDHVREYHIPPPSPTGVGFAWYDNMFTFPHDEDEAISPVASVIMSFVAPLVIFILFAIFRRSLHDLHHALLGVGAAIAIGYCIQIPITRSTGMFRPDMLDRLLSGDEDQITGGRRAFPSGHAMIAFCGYSFLTFYFMGKTKVFHAAYGNLWRVVICVAPIAAATAQAVTRIRDNRHSPVDVLGGAFIGIGTAYFGYMAHFPSFSNRWCARPKNRKARFESDWSGMMVDY